MQLIFPVCGFILSLLFNDAVCLFLSRDASVDCFSGVPNSRYSCLKLLFARVKPVRFVVSKSCLAISISALPGFMNRFLHFLATRFCSWWTGHLSREVDLEIE